MTASSPRHEMEMHVKLGAMKDGTIRGIDRTPFLTQVPMGNMDRQQSDCPGTNLFRFTEKQRHSALFTTWFIRMFCLLELIVDMVQHRDFLPL